MKNFFNKSAIAAGCIVFGAYGCANSLGNHKMENDPIIGEDSLSISVNSKFIMPESEIQASEQVYKSYAFCFKSLEQFKCFYYAKFKKEKVELPPDKSYLDIDYSHSNLQESPYTQTGEMNSVLNFLSQNPNFAEGQSVCVNVKNNCQDNEMGKCSIDLTGFCNFKIMYLDIPNGVQIYVGNKVRQATPEIQLAPFPTNLPTSGPYHKLVDWPADLPTFAPYYVLKRMPNGTLTFSAEEALKMISLNFLLHISEEFDDDILSDAIDLLHDE